MGMANGVRPVVPMDFAGVRFGFRERGPCCVVLTYDECLAVCVKTVIIFCARSTRTSTVTASDSHSMSYG